MQAFKTIRLFFAMCLSCFPAAALVKASLASASESSSDSNYFYTSLNDAVFTVSNKK